MQWVLTIEYCLRNSSVLFNSMMEYYLWCRGWWDRGCASWECRGASRNEGRSSLQPSARSFRFLLRRLMFRSCTSSFISAGDVYIYMLNKITRIVNVLIDSLSLIWMCWVQFIRIGHCYRWIIHFAVGQRQRTAEARNRTSAGNSSRDSKGGPKTWVSTRYNIRLGTIFFVYFHPVYTCTMRLLSARM